MVYKFTISLGRLFQGHSGPSRFSSTRFMTPQGICLHQTAFEQTEMKSAFWILNQKTKICLWKESQSWPVTNNIQSKFIRGKNCSNRHWRIHYSKEEETWETIRDNLFIVYWKIQVWKESIALCTECKVWYCKYTRHNSITYIKWYISNIETVPSPLNTKS